MQGYEVTLPGGLSKAGKLYKKAIFKPVTGKVEQTLIEQKSDSNRPDCITGLLSASLYKIGGFSVDDQLVSELCVADRKFLLIQLAILLNDDLLWLKICCQQCHEYFDVDINRSSLPVKLADNGFPITTIRLGDNVVVARVPNGNDQSVIHELTDDEAMAELLFNCILSVNDSEVTKAFVNQLSELEIENIDQALDQLAPAVCDQIQVSCPDCSYQQQVQLDHINLTGIDKIHFYDEIHTLASQYHWSEASILELPQERRRLYLDLINRSSGYSA